jgi:putative FmdB family regulatory protein
VPSYEYKCPKCEKHYVILHGFSSTDQYMCDDDLQGLVRVYTAPPVHFKGGGWGGSN